MPVSYSTPEKIIVLRALKLGDMLCSLPALRALRQCYPHSRITLVSHPAMADLFTRYSHLINEFIPFPGFPGMPETFCDVSEVVKFLERVQKENYDLAVQMHGSGEISNLVVSLFKAKETIGLYKKGNYCPDPENFIYYSEDTSEIHRCLSLINLLGGKTVSDELDFPLSSHDFEELRSHGALARFVERPYFCLHPGASTYSKRWAPQNFADVGDYLVKKGFKVVFTGSRAESGLVKEIMRLMEEESFNAAEINLPLGPLGALLTNSSGVICNDTGISHLAAALRVPSVIIFSETDPVRWAPLNTKLHHWLLRPKTGDVIDEIEEFLLKDLEEVV